MRGDFSRRDDEQKKKYSGVLHQQGRVLLDSDWNDQVSIQEYWKETLSRDVIGENVVAVPASVKDSFGLLNVTRNASNVTLKLEKGRAWMSGLQLRNEDNTKVRSVPLLGNAQNSDREAIIVRAWQQEVSAFQDGELLLEKALGGPDTTERIENVYTLYRLPAGTKTCAELRSEMSQFAVDNENAKIKLNVKFQPTTELAVDDQDCPAVQAGGYRGLEHSLYRIEMLKVPQDLGAEESQKPFFKWSHVNGGLVGVGVFKDEGNGKKHFIPTQNLEAFRRSGFAHLENCFLETYRVDENTGIWTADFGALVTFDGDSLMIGKIYVGQVPSEAVNNPTPRFYRLWSGLRSAQEFKSAFKDFRDGIQLHFPNADTAEFLPGDYWTFEVRANAPGEKPANFDGASAPHGPVYHNACLGVIDWTKQKPEDQVHDCRKVFDPLVDLRDGCCIEVFPEDDLAAAVRKIRQAGGGCLCLMPGKHLVREVLDLSDTRGVVFKGLGPLCELVVPQNAVLEHIFKLENSTESSFSGFSLVLHNPGVKSVWEAPSALKVSIKDTQIVCVSEDHKDFLRDTTPFQGRIVNGLELKSNLWISWKSLSVALLTDASLERNWFLFGDVGVFAVGALAVRIQENRFMVMSAAAAKSSPFAEKIHTQDPLRVQGLIASIFHSFGRWTGINNENRLQMMVLSTAVQITAGAQVDLERNLIGAARGFQALVLVDGKLDHNHFVSSWYASQVLLFCMDSVFRNNRVEGPLKKPVQVGFHFGGKATGVRVQENQIQNSAEGILFEVSRPESLFLQAMATARQHQIIESKTEDGKVAELLQKILEDSTQDLQAAARLFEKEIHGNAAVGGSENLGVDLGSAARVLLALNSLPTALLNIEDLKIQGNQVQSSWNGIEISGLRSVASYLIADNLISQCEGAALFLPGEGEDPGQEENKPRDYRKSVMGNKVLCKGVALWASQNEIRIEGNDFRVFPSAWNVPSWFKSIFELGEVWPEVEKILEEDSEGDFDNSEMFQRLVKSLVKLAQDEDLVTIVGHKESSWSSHFEILKSGDETFFPEEEKKKVFKAGQELLSTKALTMMMVALRGFAVGVWGVSSTVRMNKIEVEASTLPGGLITGSLSGEISENEISAPRLGIFLAEDPKVLKVISKAKERKILYTPVQIAGNRIAVEAALNDDGESSHFSLLIPRILRGDLSVTGNHFVGDVHIGANLNFNVEKNVLMAMDLENIKKNVSAATRKAPAHKKVVMRGAILNRILKKHDRGAQLPHPKILFSQNQTLSGAVSILPFSFTMKSVSGIRDMAKPKIELVPSEQNELPMVTFTSNQLDAGRGSSFIFGYQVMISGNQSLIETTPGDEEFSLVGMAWKNEYLYAKGNMPEAMEARHG